MPLNRAHAQEQPITDLPAREPLRDGPKDLLLPVGQRRKSFARRCVGGGAQPHQFVLQTHRADRESQPVRDILREGEILLSESRARRRPGDR